MTTTLPMISIADLHSFTRNVEVKTDLGPLQVQYRPNAMTPLRLAQLEQLSRSANEADDEKAAWAFAETFCEVVTAIPNLTGPLADEEGNELVKGGEVAPIVPEVMVRFSTLVQMRVINELQALGETEAEEQGKGPKSATKPSRKPSRRGSFDR